MLEELEQKVKDLEERMLNVEKQEGIDYRNLAFEIEFTQKIMDILCAKLGVTITPEDLTNYDLNDIENTDNGDE